MIPFTRKDIPYKWSSEMVQALLPHKESEFSKLRPDMLRPKLPLDQLVLLKESLELQIHHRLKELGLNRTIPPESGSCVQIVESSLAYYTPHNQTEWDELAPEQCGSSPLLKTMLEEKVGSQSVCYDFSQ